MALFQQAIKLRAQFGNAGFLVRHGIQIMLGAFTDLDSSQPDCWRYIREVREAGKLADATG